ncbi:MAG: hypothetical protein KDJ16_11525 [Hyphomicrobiales bacterium]|nr:hypothetical protein [Hyphomicrobiales bacterium]
MPNHFSRIIAVAIALAAISAAPAAQAQSSSPYDVTYAVRGGLGAGSVDMRSGPDAGAAVIATLPKGAKDIVMRWCRPEFNFRKWAYGGRDAHREQLKGKVCEVEWSGKTGFVDGADLRPEE